MAVLSSTSADMIELCGPSSIIRFNTNREIDLVNYLPNYLKETEVNDMTQFFQDFLNQLYEEYQIITSATEYEEENRTKISILEKVSRLTELHDPELVDIQYIQYFANLLGYNVDLNRGELGVIQNQDPEDPCVQEDINRYLRFVVTSLPNWYKIKTTRNAIKIMLYSFGLVGDLVERWTSDYQVDNGSNWINFEDGDDLYSQIPDGYYPTSHFAVKINLDESTTTFLNTTTRYNVLNAIRSVRPVSKVFDGFLGKIERTQDIFVRPYFRTKFFVHIS